ncbi:MAG: hypothetical protein FJ318_05800 [SAR202 cluster bacterium]|nr:hypothetical protein [SAR202 cluster bacterium]
MLNMHDIMLRLAARHPTVGSRDDLARHLARTIYEHFDVGRIEALPRSEAQADGMDIRIERGGAITAMRLTVATAGGDSDGARVRLWRGIEAVERWLLDGACDLGYVIDLTDDATLWAASGRPAASEPTFDIGNGHHFRGARRLDDDDAVVARNDYLFRWQLYARLVGGREWRYLVVRVDAD